MGYRQGELGQLGGGISGKMVYVLLGGGGVKLATVFVSEKVRVPGSCRAWNGISVYYFHRNHVRVVRQE